MIRIHSRAPGLLAALALLLPTLVSAQGAPPGTDIWVLELSEEGGVIRLDDPVRVTNRPGYDNQPHFSPDGEYLLYTSIDEAGQADIYRYSLDTGARERVTRTTPESEYSATIMPGGERVSVIRVEADSTQRLWSFDLSGEDPQVVLHSVMPVGYHAWIDETHLALFVEGATATLQIADVEAQTARTVAQNIGRSLHKLPLHRAASFLQWERVEGERVGIIKTFDLEDGLIEVAGRALPGNEFYAWAPWGVALSGEGSKIYSLDPREGGGWREVADLESAGINGITRLAVSAKGDRLAVVGNR